MTNKTLLWGAIGGLLGAGTGFWAGKKFDEKNKADFAAEGLAFVGGIGGAALLAAVANAQPVANPLASNTPPAVMPPPGVLTVIPPSGA